MFNANPLTNTKRSKTGSIVVRDSKTPTTFTTSGILSDMTLSSTLNPNAVVFCVSPFAVDIPEFVRFTLILLLLSNVFCFTFISFLRTVAFTTTFDADAVVKFCINKLLSDHYLI